MLKRIVLCAAVACIATSAQAGWFDFLGGGDNDEVKTEPAAKSASTVTTSTDMVTKGLTLLPLLMQTLNVTDSQAAGGMGALLQAAQKLLSGTDYSTLASAIPNAAALLSGAPAVAEKSSGSSDLLGKAMSMASEHSETAKAASDLSSQFSSLGLSAAMIPKFVDTASGFMQKSGNTEAAELLSSSIGSLL